MIKNFLKELIIALLLCLAIILALGILLYEYVPMTKTIPNEVAYETPNDIKQEIQIEKVNQNGNELVASFSTEDTIRS